MKLLTEDEGHHFDIMRSLTGAIPGLSIRLPGILTGASSTGHAQALIVIEMENGVKTVCKGAMANAKRLNNWCHDYWRAECEEATLEASRKLRAMIESANAGRIVDVQEYLRQNNGRGRTVIRSLD
jgi:hypothetical protein